MVRHGNSAAMAAMGGVVMGGVVIVFVVFALWPWL